MNEIKKEVLKMKKLEMQKIIKARAGLSNYSKISNIKWHYVRGIGAKWNNFLDDIIYFEYRGGKYRLESKYTGEYSALQRHELVLLGETNS
jgi:hypothetical protein